MTEATRRWRVGGAGDSDVNGDGDEMLGQRAGDDKDAGAAAASQLGNAASRDFASQLRESGETLPASRVVDS